MRGSKAVEKIGIAEYNRRCREVVMTYAEEWRRVVGRLGRWIDFDNDYKTLDVDFMESVMWAFKTLHDKGLIHPVVIPWAKRDEDASWTGFQ